MSRHNTPFIPPLNTPEGSPSSAPVIPGGSSGGSPNMSGWGPLPVPPPHGAYPMFSPYQAASPYIPVSPYTQPGVIPGQPPSISRNSSRQGAPPQGLSADWTGYPQGTPYSPPGNMPPQGAGHPSPWGQPPPNLHPSSPWYPPAAPAGYQAFGGTPWPPHSAPLPGGPPGAPQGTPWGMPPRGLPPASAYTPWGPPPQMQPPPGPQPGAWGIPPPNPYQAQGPPDLSGWGGGGGGGGGFGGGGFGGGGFGGGPPPPAARAPPEPPGQIFDRLNPFMEGDFYGPVLDPFLVRVVGAQVKINPLISPVNDESPDPPPPYLKWNMLFPTSTVQRSIDPSHVSWSKGRQQPATFPRVQDLFLVSETIPWMIKVKAKNPDRGVTCAEVIDAIGRDMNRHTTKDDFEVLNPPERNELRATYKHNRSPLPGVPGGMLGEGMKRLDFLRKNTMFGGIESNDRVVKKACGELMPCVFVFKCSLTYQPSKKDVEEQQRRMGVGSHAGSRRSRAGSTATRITVQSPSEDSGSESGDIDR